MPQLEPAVLQCRQHLCTAGCSWSACGKGRGLALHEALQGVGRVPQLKPAALSPTAQAAPAHSRMVSLHKEVHQTLQAVGKVLQLSVQVHPAVPTAVQAASAGAERQSRLHPAPGRAGILPASVGGP